jgi:hypothetical protein
MFLWEVVNILKPFLMDRVNIAAQSSLSATGYYVENKLKRDEVVEAAVKLKREMELKYINLYKADNNPFSGRSVLMFLDVFMPLLSASHTLWGSSVLLFAKIILDSLVSESSLYTIHSFLLAEIFAPLMFKAYSIVFGSTSVVGKDGVGIAGIVSKSLSSTSNGDPSSMMIVSPYSDVDSSSDVSKCLHSGGGGLPVIPGELRQAVMEFLVSYSSIKAAHLFIKAFIPLKIRQFLGITIDEKLESFQEYFASIQSIDLERQTVNILPPSIDNIMTMVPYDHLQRVIRFNFFDLTHPDVCMHVRVSAQAVRITRAIFFALQRSYHEKEPVYLIPFANQLANSCRNTKETRLNFRPYTYHSCFEFLSVGMMIFVFLFFFFHFFFFFFFLKKIINDLYKYNIHCRFVFPTNNRLSFRVVSG